MEIVKNWLSDGSVSGSVSGSGSGSGSGYGSGLKSFCGCAVYLIDGVQTIIDRLHHNIAKGRIINSDLTTEPCYVVKQDGKFAHGATLREAMSALMDKLFDDMSLDDRVAAFWAEFERGKKYPAMDFYHWHHRMTGSCEMGRKQFAKDNGIDLEKDEFTPEDFIHITKNAYGGDAIKALEQKK